MAARGQPQGLPLQRLAVTWFLHTFDASPLRRIPTPWAILRSARAAHPFYSEYTGLSAEESVGPSVAGSVD